MEPASSRLLVRFVSAEPRRELLFFPPVNTITSIFQMRKVRPEKGTLPRVALGSGEGQETPAPSHWLLEAPRASTEPTLQLSWAFAGSRVAPYVTSLVLCVPEAVRQG